MMTKFRAWDKEHKEMVYPDDVDKIYFEITVDGIDTYNMRHVLPYDDKPPYLDTVVMQSTGLTDKNGKEIYEGDVVKGKSDSFRLSCYGEVYWDKEFCRYRINDKEYNRKYNVDWRWKLQIIGNIHDNPELLNQPKQ